MRTPHLYISLFLCIILFPMTQYAQECTITFRVFPPSNTALYDTLYITGNIRQLGNWNPAEVPLKKTTLGYYELSIPFAKGTLVEYKITRGSWSKEAVSIKGVVPPNSKLTIEKDAIVDIHIENWKDFIHKIEGGITGEVQYHRKFKATKLENTRDVAVLLPKSYKSALQKRYPVLYMHDGQNCFDPTTSFIGVDWQIDETVDTLSAKAIIEEIIVVAVYNTPDRMQEYSDTPSGHNYMDFLINDLKPFIDKNYRTLPDKNNTAIMGSSMGGLISFLCIAYHSDVFGKAACLSTTLSSRSDKLFELAQQFTPEPGSARIYFDAGDEAKRESYKSAFDSLETILLSKGFQKDINLQFRIFEGDDHSERSWAKRVHIPLTFLFGTKH